MNAGRPTDRRAAAAAVRAAVFGLLCLATLASCMTVPPRAADTRWIDVLPADATAYLAVDVAGNRAFLNKIIGAAGPSLADVSTLLDMSRRALIAVYIKPPEAVRFQAVALGGYPSFLIGLRLGTSADWKRVETPQGAFFRNAKNLEASLPNDAVLLASTGGMEGLLERLYKPVGFPLPSDVEAAMGSADAVLYMPALSAGPAAGGGGAGGTLPIHEVWMEAKVKNGTYAISATMAVENEKSARSVALILRFVLVSWLNTEKVANVADKLKSVSITPDGLTVRLSGLEFSSDEVLSLFLSLLKPQGSEAAN